jgi:hypothetical protein
MKIFQFGRRAAPSDDLWNNASHASSVGETGSAFETEPASRVLDAQLEVPRCFLRLANVDSGVFERLGRYEAALWRQMRQTLFMLEVLRCRKSGTYHARTKLSWQRTMGLPPGEDW